jgi:hypothetical protein
MKKVQILTAGFMVAAIAVLVVAMAGGAYAGNTTDLVTVNAKVNGMCSKTVAGIFNTLAIDPSNVADQPFTVGTDASVQCTKSLATTSITATSANGTANLVPCTGGYLTGFTVKSVSGATINYSFACAAGVTGIGFGTAGDGVHDVSLGMAAKVLAADVQTANYDNGNTYTDTVTLTINF